jgi:hypothetical protein
MAVTPEQFAENLTKSGLFSAEELAAFQEGLPPQKAAQRPGGPRSRADPGQKG